MNNCQDYYQDGIKLPTKDDNTDKYTKLLAFVQLVAAKNSRHHTQEYGDVAESLLKELGEKTIDETR